MAVALAQSPGTLKIPLETLDLEYLVLAEIFASSESQQNLSSRDDIRFRWTPAIAGTLYVTNHQLL